MARLCFCDSKPWLHVCFTLWTEANSGCHGSAITLAVLTDARKACSIPNEESEESYINLIAYPPSANPNSYFNLHSTSHSPHNVSSFHWCSRYIQRAHGMLLFLGLHITNNWEPPQHISKVVFEQQAAVLSRLQATYIDDNGKQKYIQFGTYVAIHNKVNLSLEYEGVPNNTIVRPWIV